MAKSTKSIDFLHDSILGASSLSFAVLESSCTKVYTCGSPFLIPRICSHLLSHAKSLVQKNCRTATSWRLLGAGFFLFFSMMIWGQGVCFSAENEAVDPIFQKPDFWEDEPYNRGTLGYKYSWNDEKSSEMKSGIKEGDRIQEYWLPDKRHFEDLDLEASAEYLRHNYTPYALGALITDVRLGKTLVPKGFYQVKLGQWQDGSLNTNLNQLKADVAKTNAQQTQAMTKGAGARQVESPIYEPKGLGDTKNRPPKNLAQQKAMQKPIDVLILINMGKVMAVIPIDEKQFISGEKRFETVPVPTQQYSTYNQQWGKLTVVENFRARKNETYARPTFHSFAKNDEWLTLEITQRHWQFRAFVPRAIPAY